MRYKNILIFIIIVFSCGVSTKNLGTVKYSHGFMGFVEKTDSNKTISLIVDTLYPINFNDHFYSYGWFDNEKAIYLTDETPKQLIERNFTTNLEKLNYSVKLLDDTAKGISSLAENDNEFNTFLNDIKSDYLIFIGIESINCDSNAKLINKQYVSSIKATYMIIKIPKEGFNDENYNTYDDTKFIRTGEINVSSTHKWIFTNSRNMRKSLSKSIGKSFKRIYSDFQNLEKED